MTALCVIFVFIATTFGTGWTLLSDLPEFGYPTGIYSPDDQFFVVTLEESFSGSFISNEIKIDLSGNQSETLSEHYAGSSLFKETLFFASPFPEDIEDPSTFAAITRVTLSRDTLWTTQLDSIEGRVETRQPIIPCREGGCFAVFSPNNADFIWKTYKLSDLGEVQMSSEFQMQGGPVIEISSVIETEDSNFLILGTTDDFGMNLYMFLVGIKSDGNQYISLKKDLRFHASGTIVEIDEDGNIYLAGYTGFEREDGYFMPPQNSDIFLIKLDSAGNELWSSVYEYPKENRPVFMTISENGIVAILMKSFSYESNDELEQYSVIIYQQN